MICDDCLALIAEVQKCIVPDCDSEIDPKETHLLDLRANNAKRDEQAKNLELKSEPKAQSDLKLWLQTDSPLKHYFHSISMEKLESLPQKEQNRISEKFTWYMTAKLSLSKIKTVYKRFLCFLTANKIVFARQAEFERIVSYVIKMLLVFRPDQFINNDPNFKIFVSRDKVKIRSHLLLVLRSLMEKIMRRPPHHTKELFVKIDDTIEMYNWILVENHKIPNYLVDMWPVERPSNSPRSDDIFTNLSRRKNEPNIKSIQIYSSPAQRAKKQNWIAVQYGRAYANKRQQLSADNAAPLRPRDAAFFTQVLPSVQKIATVIQNIQEGKLRESVTKIKENDDRLVLFAADIGKDIVGAVIPPIPDRVSLLAGKESILFSLGRRRAYRVPPDATNYLISAWMNDRLEIGSRLTRQ